MSFFHYIMPSPTTENAKGAIRLAKWARLNGDHGLAAQFLNDAKEIRNWLISTLKS